MALPRLVLKSQSCLNCRQWVLRSFLASLGTSPIPQSLPLSRRAITTTAKRWDISQDRAQTPDHEEHALNEINDTYIHLSKLEAALRPASPQPVENQPVEQESHVPWYLQVEPAFPPQESAISARQRVPNLPEHPPPVLEPLLQRVSVELGMDDLSLLDLRGIDPPPALGANLLMIIGTARSEKHLHFSADKLCRWLRSEHHLTPYADGLLGRQELKLKLRRRAKKSRLLSAVGAKSPADTELDEGIRTGWICVNLGKVEGGELPKTEEQKEREKDIVGFGTGTTGSNIVVQLLTEDKRSEIDLEKLWNAVLKKSNKEREALSVDPTVPTTESAVQATGL